MTNYVEIDRNKLEHWLDQIDSLLKKSKEDQDILAEKSAALLPTKESTFEFIQWFINNTNVEEHALVNKYRSVLWSSDRDLVNVSYEDCTLINNCLSEGYFNVYIEEELKERTQAIKEIRRIKAEKKLFDSEFDETMDELHEQNILRSVAFAACQFLVVIGIVVILFSMFC